MREATTDLWVYELLKQAKIEGNLTPQGSENKILNDALRSASKKKNGNVGRPEYVGLVKDYVLVIENKADTNKHIKRDKNKLISEDVKDTKDYAVNGALHYGIHIAKNTSYKKIIAIGISGSEKLHEITPLFINERGDYEELDDLNTLIYFSNENIDKYYLTEILKEKLDVEKETEEILKDAEKLHKDLRNYGNIEEKNKPLIVSGILLALRELKYGFSLESLTGDAINTDGKKIYQKIKDNLERSNVSPEVKKDKILNQFAVIKDHTKINEINNALGQTPIKYFVNFLYNSVFKQIEYGNSSEDFLGRFYGEFMSYSGGDGQNLGIVLTPKHITELFCDLLELKPEDRILDPCCGTGGFLIAGMHNMIKKAKTEEQIRNIKQNQLFGIEEQSYMFTIATTNMILRGDGKSNLENKDFFKTNPHKTQLRQCNVGMINPPYSMGSKDNTDLYEINFINHLLDSIIAGGKVAAIVPESTMVGGRSKFQKQMKKNLLSKNTLEGVITLNPNTFYNVGTNPCIAIFTAGIPHDKNKLVKFINFKDDGFVIKKHIGLTKTPNADDKKQNLLNMWFNDNQEFKNSICVKEKITVEDEWIHSFYYFNDDLPKNDEFENAIADYLSFEVNMINHGKSYLFGEKKDKDE